MAKLWLVEGKGKFVVKATVYDDYPDMALDAVKERVAEHVSNFVSVSIVDVRARINKGTWTVTEAPQGIIQLNWDVAPRSKI